MVKKVSLTVCLLFLFLIARSQDAGFDQLATRFVLGYKVLNIADLSLSYVDNLNHIKGETAIDTQVVFFTGINRDLHRIVVKNLSKRQNADYRLMVYETDLNLERLILEKQWIRAGAIVNDKGLNKQFNGKLWYAYFLKKWVCDEVTPDQIFAFGLKEVDRVKGHIESIRRQTGFNEDAFYKHLNDPAFFESDTAAVQAAFVKTRDIIYANMGKLFSPQTIPALNIKKGQDLRLAQTPGYYDNNTFYYNLFNKPYNMRQIDWLFIHEAVPGHHYQSSINNAANTSAVQQLFYYLGFAEGWGAYAEELGKPLGVYKTPYDELGKWEWDIVRSVRVPLDVGINYYGWTDEQALAFWKKNIRNQDDIALREIARIKRWPAQVVTYKYGALKIMQWRAQLQKQQGTRFDIKNFHDRVLMHGSLPLAMVKANVFE